MHLGDVPRAVTLIALATSVVWIIGFGSGGTGTVNGPSETPIEISTSHRAEANRLTDTGERSVTGTRTGIRSTTRTPTTSIPRTASPTSTATTSRERIAPGVSTTRIVNASRLVDAHVAVLSNTSYTAHRGQIFEQDGSIGQLYTQTVKSGPNERFLWLRWFVFPESVFTSPDGYWFQKEWSNGSTGVRLNGNGIDIDRHVGSARAAETRYLDGVESLLSTLFSSLRMEITNRTTLNGNGVIYVESTGIERPDVFSRAFPTIGRFDRVSFRAAIRTDGLVVWRRLVVSGTSPSRRIRLVISTRYSDVGTTTVSRPGWVSTILNGSD